MQRIGFNNLAQIESNMVHQNQYPAREYMHLTDIYLSQTIQSRQILQSNASLYTMNHYIASKHSHVWNG